MEVAAAMDFNFNSSPYTYTDPYYTSTAPSSPTRELYCEFDELFISANAKHTTSSLASVPFSWEEKPGVPKGGLKNSFQDDDFSFDVGFQLGSDSVPADDLFHGGVIKPFGGSPARKEERQRGRERGSLSSSSRLPSSRSRRTRSLSPLGSSDYRREQQLQVRVANTKPQSSSSGSGSGSGCASCAASSSMENGSRKWSFKDLFLFRSASDGRAMDRDPLKKYSTFFRKHDHDQDGGSSSESKSRRRGRVSAHEVHYNLNRAVSNDMKRKTFLPYKQGILG